VIKRLRTVLLSFNGDGHGNLTVAEGQQGGQTHKSTEQPEHRRDHSKGLGKD